MFRILVVEDNISLQKLYCSVLRSNGFDPLAASNGSEALDVMSENHVDLILLDITMPVMDGIAFITHIREGRIDTPVIVVTARSSQDDKRRAFTAGADDYMVKPIDEEEMILRIKAVLRRIKVITEKIVEIGSTRLYYDSLLVDENGVQTYLPKKEFYLLYRLLSAPGQILSKNQLLDEIWGFENESDNTINVHINRLRKKFADNPDFEILTVRGVGFKGQKKEAF